MKGVQRGTRDKRRLVGDPKVLDGIEGVCEDDALDLVSLTVVKGDERTYSVS